MYYGCEYEFFLKSNFQYKKNDQSDHEEMENKIIE